MMPMFIVLTARTLGQTTKICPTALLRMSAILGTAKIADLLREDHVMSLKSITVGLAYFVDF
jgi:hypothetical protein